MYVIVGAARRAGLSPCVVDSLPRPLSSHSFVHSEDMTHYLGLVRCPKTSYYSALPPSFPAGAKSRTISASSGCDATSATSIKFTCLISR